MTIGKVLAVHRSIKHEFSKRSVPSIKAIAGFGIEGDAHCGVKVKHRSRVRADPNQPNLRQVHLIHSELFEEMIEHGFDLKPGQLGENITTQGINLLRLGRDDRLHIGNVVLKVTGLRNPCTQIEAFRPGLLRHLAFRDGGEIVRKAGIMTIVEISGVIRAGDLIEIESAPGSKIKLDRV